MFGEAIGADDDGADGPVAPHRRIEHRLVVQRKHRELGHEPVGEESSKTLCSASITLYSVAIRHQPALTFAGISGSPMSTTSSGRESNRPQGPTTYTSAASAAETHVVRRDGTAEAEP